MKKQSAVVSMVENLGGLTSASVVPVIWNGGDYTAIQNDDDVHCSRHQECPKCAQVLSPLTYDECERMVL